MKQVKTSRWLAGAAACLLLLAAGCANKLALKFTPHDSTTYRVVSESERGIKWEGAVPDEPTFQGGRNYNRLEMTFAQEVQSVDDKGNAIAEITIKGLKSYSKSKSGATFEFDSLKSTDPNKPLARLIGQSYTIKIAPTGKVIKVIDTKKAEKSVKKSSENLMIAFRLLQPKAIEERHGTIILPDAKKNQLQIGDSWSETKRFSFGMMGAESFEKIYTLNGIKNQNNRKIAIIEMKAIPSSKTEKEIATADLFKSSDSTKIYTGELKLDLTTGKIEKYSENLKAEWITIFPSAKQETGQEEPAILTMSDTRSYSINKID